MYEKKGDIDPEACKHIPEIKRYSCRCTRCSKEWVTVRDKIPVACPQCSSPYWRYLRMKDYSKDLIPETSNS